MPRDNFIVLAVSRLSFFHGPTVTILKHFNAVFIYFTDNVLSISNDKSATLHDSIIFTFQKNVACIAWFPINVVLYNAGYLKIHSSSFK